MNQRDDRGAAHQPTRGAQFAMLLSALGLIGWLGLIVVLLPYQEESGTYADEWHNFFAFGANLALVVILGGISGVLSFCGLAAGLVAAEHPPRKMAWTGVAFGAVGLLVGVGVLCWRFWVLR